ncbi:FlgD immunoglobulin-like domain containing protein [Conexibacter sp. DBS9H8]|uniref:FlgD immunoglobulin-like domain containing protein n=1 Tax=Conexibacter sp. DBS9H8 TaxID=2937801 RepID=UPI00200BAD01|nr:FlgD immunoglobulin-like domain containing protein [Conexibacter sp. DBS9H8]
MKLPDRLSPRVPATLFGLLVLATVGAFYLTQHLKVQNPLINGNPRADPAVINPVAAGVCADAAGKRVSFRHTRLGFYLQTHSDVVTVQVLNGEGQVVATMGGSGRYIRAGFDRYAFFTWDGRLADGARAPAGVYTFLVSLAHQDRTVPVTGASVRVQYGRPRPQVTAVTVSGRGALTGPPGSTPTFTPGRATATVHLDTRHDLGVRILVYRAGANGSHPLQLVQSFGVNPRLPAVWNGLINGRPAPAGSYLLGAAVTDASCTTGQFPPVTDPAPGSTPGAGVNVSYLSATPPLEPVAAGALAAVDVNSGGAPYRWLLRRAGAAAVIFRGTNPGAATMHVRLPRLGLYTLTVTAGRQATSVPLVASGTGAAASAPVLVVLPALSWQGANPIDDNAGGLIDTLADGAQVSLERPLVNGLPAGLADEAALLSSLDAAHRVYDLTTDVALAEGVGPTLRGRHGVLLDGAFTWLPTQLAGRLGAFVRGGGAVFNAAVHSLTQTAALVDGQSGPAAGPARGLAADPFGVRHGALSATAGALITPFTDGLGIFSTAAVFPFSTYQALEPPGGRVSALAGVAPSAPAVIGFHLGAGTVVEAGLPNFGLSLIRSVDSQELLARVWQVVLR